MSVWLQNIVQDHAQSLGISETHANELAISLLPVLEKYRMAILPRLVDDGMWLAAQEHAVNLDYTQAAALYRAFVKEYTQRK